MDISPAVGLGLEVGFGLFWSLVYILVIKRGFQDKSVGMPSTAISANIAWEFVFSFIHPHGAPQVYINVAWFILDSVILFQALKFGMSDFNRNLPAPFFYSGFLLTLVLSLWAVLSITYEFRDWDGTYAAFGGNLLMSVLFVNMLLRRNNVCGQSMYIAVFKMLGTLLASILFFTAAPSSRLLNFLYVAILIFDSIYVVMLYTKHKELEINPWNRF